MAYSFLFFFPLALCLANAKDLEKILSILFVLPPNLVFWWDNWKTSFIQTQTCSLTLLHEKLLEELLHLLR